MSEGRTEWDGISRHYCAEHSRFEHGCHELQDAVAELTAARERIRELEAFARNIACTLEDPRFPPDAPVWDRVVEEATRLMAPSSTSPIGTAE